MGTMLFALGLMSFISVLTVVIPTRWPPLAIPVFFISWLENELVVWQLIVQIGLAILLVSCGALDFANGQYGLTLLLVSWLGKLTIIQRAYLDQTVLKKALKAGLGEDYQYSIDRSIASAMPFELTPASWLKPFALKNTKVKRHQNIAYAEGGVRNHLDIYRPKNPPSKPMPVLLQIHGGGWIIGNKEEQALPLINYMAERNWVCVAINYRLSPADHFPAHIIDVKKAIVWIKENIAQYGGDPNFIVATGGSAGGHLSLLAGVSANTPEFQPGFEDKDTSVQGVVPFYGVYDWVGEPAHAGTNGLQKLLSSQVFPEGGSKFDPLWRQASPLLRELNSTPPIFLIHGKTDALARVDDAQHMFARLKQESNNIVAYAELPNAQHAFDVFHSIRADFTVIGVAQFLEYVRSQASTK